MFANKQQKPTLNNNKLQEICQDLATSSTMNIGLIYAEELSALHPVAMIANSDHVFDNSSTKELIELLSFKL